MCDYFCLFIRKTRYRAKKENIFIIFQIFQLNMNEHLLTDTIPFTDRDGQIIRKRSLARPRVSRFSSSLVKIVDLRNFL